MPDQCRAVRDPASGGLISYVTRSYVRPYIGPSFELAGEIRMKSLAADGVRRYTFSRV